MLTSTLCRRSVGLLCGGGGGGVATLSRRAWSAATMDELVTTTMDEDTGIATLTMNNPPVNSLSLEMLQALSVGIKSAEAHKRMQGLILQSSKPGIFSAGLDLAEMHQPDAARIRDFWHAFQQLYLDLYGSRLACVAAMEGHAPAAGCMLALSCDVRIMASDTSATIGLNETKLGIAAPPWLGQQMIDTVGRRPAEKALSLGTLYPADEALQLGLVDTIVPLADVPVTAQQVAAQWAAIPPQARVASKLLVRGDRMQRLLDHRADDLDQFVMFVTNDKVQAQLTAYLQMLAAKKKK